MGGPVAPARDLDTFDFLGARDGAPSSMFESPPFEQTGEVKERAWLAERNEREGERRVTGFPGPAPRAGRPLSRTG